MCKIIMEYKESCSKSKMLDCGAIDYHNNQPRLIRLTEII